MKHFSLPKDGGLIEKGLPKDILHSKERIYTEILDTPYIASQMVAAKSIMNVENIIRNEELDTIDITKQIAIIALLETKLEEYIYYSEC